MIRFCLFIGCALLILASCAGSPKSKTPAYRVEYYKEKKILVGQVSAKNIWEQMPDWKADYFIYEPDPVVVEKLSAIRKPYHIICVLGIWCPDSKAGVPGFLRALDMAANPALSVELHAVDRQKKDPGHTAEKFGIERVPTFIVFSGNQEIGRMIEYPTDTFEADLVKLLER